MTEIARHPITVFDLSGQTLGPLTAPWPASAAADVKVALEVAGVEQALSGAGQVTVTLNGQSEPVVTLNAAVRPVGGWAAGTRLIVRRDTPAEQPVDYPALSRFAPGTVMQSLDYLTRQVQDLKARLLNTVAMRAGEQGLRFAQASTLEGRILYTSDGMVRGGPTLALFAADVQATAQAAQAAQGSATSAAQSQLAAEAAAAEVERIRDEVGTDLSQFLPDNMQLGDRTLTGGTFNSPKLIGNITGGLVVFTGPSSITGIATDIGPALQQFLDQNANRQVIVSGIITLDTRVQIRPGMHVRFLDVVRPMRDFRPINVHIGGSVHVAYGDIRTGLHHGVNLPSYFSAVVRIDGSTHDVNGPALHQGVMSSGREVFCYAVANFNDPLADGWAVEIVAPTVKDDDVTPSPDSRVTGYRVVARSFWTRGIKLIQSGGTNDRFVNSNDIVIYCDGPKTALEMRDSTPGKTAVAANNIQFHIQARETQLSDDVPVIIDGQFNRLDGILWDYYGGGTPASPGAVPGIRVVPGANYNHGRIVVNTPDTYHQDASGLFNNQFDYVNDTTRTLSAESSFTLRVAGTNVFTVLPTGVVTPNNMGYQSLDSSGVPRTLLRLNGDNNVIDDAPNFSGSLRVIRGRDGLFYNTWHSGLSSWVNALSIDSNRHMAFYGNSRQEVLFRNFNAAPRVVDMCDGSGIMALYNDGAPSGTWDVGDSGTIRADENFIYIYTTAGWKKAALTDL